MQMDVLHDELNLLRDKLLQKDSTIAEMNVDILEKERQIDDLQEICRSQNQVALSKSLAIDIVNSRLREIDNRQMRDVSTETDFANSDKKIVKQKKSPGRAVQLRGSPPPVDPQAEDDNFTSYDLDSCNYEGLVDFQQDVNKYRKKVTFDLKKKQMTNHDLVAENAHVGRSFDNKANKSLNLNDIDQCYKEEINKIKQEHREQLFRTRALGQAKKKNLEDSLEHIKASSLKEIEGLKSINESMKESREWSLAENARLSELITYLKQKCEDLHGELDISLKSNLSYRDRFEESGRAFDKLTAELNQIRSQNREMHEDKLALGAEIERLKNAIFAQEELISVLEGDLIVYEERVGILRDSLGASKNEERQHFRSKAYAAKINALEMENKEIAKKNKDEKIRTKALAVKVQCLEMERDQLLAKIWKYDSSFNQNSYSDNKEKSVVLHDQLPCSQTEHDICLSEFIHSLISSLNQYNDIPGSELLTDLGNEEKCRLEAVLPVLLNFICIVSKSYSETELSVVSLKNQFEQLMSSYNILESANGNIDDFKEKVKLEKEEMIEALNSSKKLYFDALTELATFKEELLSRNALIVDLQTSLGIAKEEYLEHKARLEFRLGEVDKQILEVMVEKEEMGQRILVLQVENGKLLSTLTRERERNLGLINRLQCELEKFHLTEIPPAEDLTLSQAGTLQIDEGKEASNYWPPHVLAQQSLAELSSLSRQENFEEEKTIENIGADELTFQKSSDLLFGQGVHDIEITSRKISSAVAFPSDESFYNQRIRAQSLPLLENKSTPNHQFEKLEQPCEKKIAQDDSIADLRNEQESALNVLKSEIWSLNQELERFVEENGYIKNQISILEQANDQFNSENGILKSELLSKEQEFLSEKGQFQEEIRQLQIQNEGLEAQFSSIMLSLSETSDKLKVSDKHIINLKSLILQIVKVFRSNIRSLVTEQIEFSQELIVSLQEMNVYCRSSIEKINNCLSGLLEKQSEEAMGWPVEKDQITHKCCCCLQQASQLTILAARLVSKCSDNDALLRANSKLTLENGALQSEIELLKRNKGINGISSEAFSNNVLVDNAKGKSPNPTCTTNLSPVDKYEKAFANVDIDISDQEQLSDVMTSVVLKNECCVEMAIKCISTEELMQKKSDVPLLECENETKHFFVHADWNSNDGDLVTSIPDFSSRDDLNTLNSEQQFTNAQEIKPSACAQDSHSDWNWSVEAENEEEPLEKIESVHENDSVNDSQEWAWDAKDCSKICENVNNQNENEGWDW